MIRFLCPLIREIQRKVLLILDRLKVLRARLTQGRLAGLEAEIEKCRTEEWQLMWS